MSPQVFTHLAAAIGAAALGIVALSRGARSQVLTGVFLTALSIAFWNTSNAFNVMTADPFWRILSPSLGALPFGAFTSLSLRASLRDSRLRRGLEFGTVGLSLALAGVTLLAFASGSIRSFVLSPSWNVALIAVALPCLIVNTVALLRGALRGSRQQRQFSLVLLVAGAVGFAGGLSEVVPTHNPAQVGALGLLLAVLIGAVGVTTRALPEESIALKELLFSLGVTTGIVVTAVLVVSRTQGQPALAAVVLSGFGLLAFAAYRLVFKRWQRRLAEAARLAALGRATSVLAHEVRNPLTTVKGVVDILEVELGKGEPASDNTHYLEVVRGELQRVLDLVEDCLTYARAPAPSADSFDLRQLLQRAVEAARLRFPETQVELQVAAAPVQVVGDASQLGRLVENLLVNACQSSERPVVRVALEEAGAQEVSVSVCDDGPGVAPELRERIFEPFFTTKARGGGLGLAIVREIARRHGGDVEAWAVEPRGARFVARWLRQPEQA